MSSEPKPGKRKSDECLTDNQPKKISIKLSEKPPAIAPVKLNLTAQSKHHEPNKVTNSKVQEVFNSDDEEEEEVIPEEARIRMRNLGRYTPTSAGPNSYGKGKFGFIDRRALLNRQTEAINEYLSEDNT
ncbi:hypothetical protein EG68_08502 [Paragonimus skrjabini miyazakii]|uniref:PEST proteolytic signal-containing nuclear protein n=1 Tax=Paragonimus skrjabini miyazakii TaxID=59628 RepID=A0A8S9YNK2_9TREM|nr:hypothetical protein EG68_08502 [Paragonimus skrjabini miyazakii]